MSLRENSPANSSVTGVLFESDADTADGALSADISQLKKAEKREFKLVWRNIILLSLVHLVGLYGVYLFLFHAKWPTRLFTIILYWMGTVAATAGAHRLWSHRSYKAKWPLRALLVFFNLTTFHFSCFHWARDHRVHHKYADTDDDPHNSSRGFFFAHVGWLLIEKPSNVVARGKSLDLSDLYADRILMFEHKYYFKLVTLLGFVLPTIIPMYMWNESFINTFCVAVVLRLAIVLNAQWSINSVAHMFGTRPYDKNINPTQTVGVSIVCLGEGWHNYHHAFPWDYRAAEWGGSSLNLAAAFIEFFAKIGWAYDLKTVSPEMIERRVKRTGDGNPIDAMPTDHELSPMPQSLLLDESHFHYKQLQL
uniref:Fatty acid desaturase domain-containing protein n=1 Tax=Glossina palpalis gambiensis TaxID=67801 RepID=A0A1B0B3V7_9MUSC